MLSTSLVKENWHFTSPEDHWGDTKNRLLPMTIRAMAWKTSSLVSADGEYQRTGVSIWYVLTISCTTGKQGRIRACTCYVQTCALGVLTRKQYIWILMYKHRRWELLLEAIARVSQVLWVLIAGTTMLLAVGRWGKEQTQRASPGSDTWEIATEWMRDTEKETAAKIMLR